MRDTIKRRKLRGVRDSTKRYCVRWMGVIGGGACSFGGGGAGLDMMAADKVRTVVQALVWAKIWQRSVSNKSMRWPAYTDGVKRKERKVAGAYSYEDCHKKYARTGVSQPFIYATELPTGHPPPGGELLHQESGTRG